MRLENNYYEITGTRCDTTSGTFHIALLKDCDVYRGHFPGNPVCPGVCNIQTIKECAEKLVDKTLTISTIKLCRLTAVATPTVCPELDVTVNIAPTTAGYAVTASIADDKHTYIDFKGEMMSV